MYYVCVLLSESDGARSFTMSKISARIRFVGIAFLALVCSTAIPDTGSGVSGRFSIDNRSGSGLRVKSLVPTYQGVFPEGVEIINTFTATVDWAGKTPSKVVFKLNGAPTDVATVTSSAKTTYNMGSDLEYSRGGAKNELIVYAVASDGATSQASQVNVWGLELPEWAISFETKKGPISWKVDALTGKLTFYGEVEVLKERPGGTVNIPEWIPEIGGEYGVKINPLNFQWELSAQARYGDGAGLTGSFDLGGTWGAEAKFGSKRKGEISATLSGAGEFYPQFKLTDVSAELAGKFTFLLPRAPLLCHWGCCHTGYCPYFQASITPEVKGVVGLEEGEPSLIAGLKFKNAELELGVTLAGTVGAGSEGGIYYIAGTIGGKPYVVLQFPPDPSSSCLNEYIKKVAFDLTARADFECLGYKWKEEWTFNLYTCPETGLMYVVAMPASEKRIVPVEREYLRAKEGYCVFPARKGGVGLMSVGGLPAPILNVGTVPAPSVAATSNEGLLLFVFDANDKPTGKHQEIHYARWTGSSWGAHAPLTNNTRLDLYPAAAIAPDGSQIAVWVTAPEPNGSETGPRDILPGFEVAFSRYDSGAGSWPPPQTITDNNFVDILPWFEKLPGGEIRLCWIASPDNAIPVWHDEGIAPSLDLMAANWDGSAFGAPYLVAGGLSAVSPPSVCRTDTHEFLTYLKDADANSATADDREVMVRVRQIDGEWEADEQLTNDALSDSAAQAALDEADTPTVVWVKRMVPTPLPDGNDTYVDQLWFAKWDGGSWGKPLLGFEAAGIAEPKLIRNEAGRLILFWVAASKEFSDIYYSAYDSGSMQWGLPQQITHDQGAETMLSLAESGGNILAGYVKRRIDLSDANGLPKIGLSDIYLLEHIPAKDLFISPNDISVSIAPNLDGLAGFCSYWLDEGCGEPNGWCHQADLDHNGTVDFNDYSLFVRDNGLIAEICADVHLSGDFIVEDVNVSFYDGDPNSDTLIGSEIIDTILPGQAKQVKVKWYVPGDKQTHHICVVVDPNNEIPETDDIGNNKAYVTLFKPDVKAESIAVLGYPGANTVLVGFSVKNSSQTVANPFACQVRKDSETGEIVHTAQIGTLAPRASAQSQFAWDVSGEDANNYTLVVVADANDQIDESDEGNNTVSGQIPVLPDLEAMQWSGRIDGGMAYVTVRNVGAKPSVPTVVRVNSETSVLGEQAIGALIPGDSVDVSISILAPPPGVRVEITVNPDSDGSDEVSLLNNTAIVLL